jgi:hypothetical protein
MTQTATLRTWQDLLDLDPSLAGIDRVLADYRQRVKASNQWRLYEDAKFILSQRVGWNACDARAELRTTEAYEIGIAHICDVLGV